MLAAGYAWNRGNQNRLAQFPHVVARVEEIRKHSKQIVDLRKIDRGRLLIELARSPAPIYRCGSQSHQLDRRS
jgi:hypothetical protein